MSLLSACVPSGTNSGKRKVSSDNSTTTGAETEAGDPEDVSDVSWFNSAYVTGALTINEDVQTVSYLRGSSVHAFLSANDNYLKQFCIVATFTQSGTSADLYRVRAIPLAITNFTTKVKERMLKVEFANSSTNSSSCSGSVYRLNASNQNIDPSPFATGSYEPTAICPTCNSTISAQNVSLYEVSSNTISSSTIIEGAKINLSTTGLRIDTSNNQTNPGTTCSNSSCLASGYSCCLDNQCVTDAATKPNPDTNDLALALADVAVDPLRYSKWPSVYFVCPTAPTLPPETPEPTDPSTPADEDFNKKLAQYNCLAGAALTVPDYTDCTPTADITGWGTVRLEVWTQCGCQADPFPTDPSDPSCVDYGLKVTKNAFNVVTTIECKVPPEVDVPTPFSGVATVSAKSSPHRFYNTDGTNYDDFEELAKDFQIDPTINVAQEGEEFSYLNESSKSEPELTTFSMNSIIGQMNIDLNHALPAKQIDIVQSQTYILYTQSGFYTPCPQCASDYWFNTFKPFPSVTTSSYGTGVQASGWTSSRTQYQSNTSNANYEDNIFGRACFVPPTMLPFSHKKLTTLNDQRRNRLTTQAAYWINGYQRDWFGFNKGALIGSFNGVNWFAVGNGRRVIAETNKLYLAINAPFADLTDPTTFTVKIVEDQGSQTVSNYDYDPSLSMLDSTQNLGASCRQYHQCTTDTDCVTRLGWEYTCADVSDFETYWPIFDADGNELANSEQNTIGYAEMLTNGYTGSSSNRCVYRGSGSPCKVAYSTGGLTSNTQELFQCAPNFYCSASGSNNFNQLVEREPNKVNSIIYGHDADILGRPLSYSGPSGKGESLAIGTLPSEVQSNLLHNSAIFFGRNESSAGAQDFGLCRPGKNISTDVWVDQQSSQDGSRRTDYISQIGSCDSSYTNSISTLVDHERVRACPTFDTDGNYLNNSIPLLDGFGVPIGVDLSQNHLQNMCGKQSQISSGTSTFANIEAASIGSLSNLLLPSVAVDACLRRAGAVCHTDLDCSPNSLHEGETNFFDKSAFGGNEAEQSFWSESLVCGQAAPKPIAGLGLENDYDFSKNRCCREVGKNLSMFTAGDTTIIPTNTNNPSIGNGWTASWINPSPAAVGRYNRYTNVEGLASKPTITATEAPYPQIPSVRHNGQPRAFQWKAINDAGRLTCCGGGWIRKFADGTNNWATASSKLNLTVSNFQCLNYQTNIQEEIPTDVDPINYSQALNFLCFNPQNNNGCIQVPLREEPNFEIHVPTTYTLDTAIIDTTPDEDPGNGTLEQVSNLSSQVPFLPIYVNNPTTMSTAVTPGNYFRDPLFRYGVSIAIPAYLTPLKAGDDFVKPVALANITVPNPNLTNIVSVSINYALKDGGGFQLDDITDNYLANCPGHSATNIPTTWTNPANDIPLIQLPDPPIPAPPTDEYAPYVRPYAQWCMAKDKDGNLDVIHVRADARAIIGSHIAGDWTYAGLVIEFKTQNSLSHSRPPGAATVPLNGGNDLYYLSKLGRLELLGIPQIHYEPIYCNDNMENLVPGIFDLDNQTRTDFDLAANSINYTPATWGNKTLAGIYDEGNVEVDASASATPKIVLQNKVELAPVFSPDQFKCCIELGGNSANAGNCCSNHAVNGVCKLPTSTNLFVYFNKFVSGDGVGEEQPGGGLLDTDFVPQTGEPKLNQEAHTKIKALGEEYCESGNVRKGGAFGKFVAQPNNGTVSGTGDTDLASYYSIIDSVFDSEGDSADNAQGMQAFTNGYRWDHHMYCAP